MNNRNLPCWCGSEKKYKKCHLQADEVFDTATQINRRMDNLKKKPNNGKLLALYNKVFNLIRHKLLSKC